MTTAERIKKARLQLGLTQRQLALKVGVDQMTVSKWERGTPPSDLNRVKLAEAVGVHPNWFLLGEEEAA